MLGEMRSRYVVECRLRMRASSAADSSRKFLPVKHFLKGSRAPTRVRSSRELPLSDRRDDDRGVPTRGASGITRPLHVPSSQEVRRVPSLDDER